MKLINNLRLVQMFKMRVDSPSVTLHCALLRRRGNVTLVMRKNVFTLYF
jgi:hypothetical protein